MKGREGKDRGGAREMGGGKEGRGGPPTGGSCSKVLGGINAPDCSCKLEQDSAKSDNAVDNSVVHTAETVDELHSSKKYKNKILSVYLSQNVGADLRFINLQLNTSWICKTMRDVPVYWPAVTGNH